MIGVSNFEAVAAAVPEDARAGRSLAVVIDAKRSDLYVQAFGAAPGAAPGADSAPVTPARAIAPAELSAFLSADWPPISVYRMYSTSCS